MRSSDCVVEAADGRTLRGTAWEPPHVRGAVVVASATGVPRRIYAPLAAHLAEAGLAVLTFDYRGIGDSRDGPLRGEPARMEDWGRLDLEGALGWMRRQHPGVPLLVLGHSAGGQLIGLAPSARHLAGALTVGAQLGWAGYWPWPARGLMLACWYLLIPVLSRLVGYLPMKSLGQGENLPRGVALQWAEWGRRRHYLFDALGPEVRAAYAALAFPLRATHIGDDGYAPRAGVAALAGFYGGPREVLSVTPAEAGTRSIGHFGWVRPRFRDTVWTPIRDWLLARVPAVQQPPVPENHLSAG
jgi:predicted alpha/beta hydrolase